MVMVIFRRKGQVSGGAMSYSLPRTFAPTESDRRLANRVGQTDVCPHCSPAFAGQRRANVLDKCRTFSPGTCPGHWPGAARRKPDCNEGRRPSVRLRLKFVRRSDSIRRTSRRFLQAACPSSASCHMLTAIFK